MARVQGFPNVQSRLVNPQSGVMEQVWVRFFQTLFDRTGGASGTDDVPAGPVLSPTLGGSPFAYTVPSAGSVFLAGGRITGVTFKRGTEQFTTTGWFPVGWVPVASGDVLTIAYTDPPTTFRFMPS